MKALILTEGGKNRGFGHISRCLSLYHAFLEKKVETEMLVAADVSVKQLLKGVNFRLCDWHNDIGLFERLSCTDIAVVDSYCAGTEFYRRVAAAARLGIYFDDTRRIIYPRGIVLNGAIHAGQLRYPAGGGRQYLLGPRYALVRKEFWSGKGHVRRRDFSVLTVTLGGSDIRRLYPRLLRLLTTQFPGLTKQVVFGEPPRSLRLLRRLKDRQTVFYTAVDAVMLKQLFRESDAVLCAGGQTTNELARLGVPGIAVCVADNQAQIIRGWSRAGSLINAGRWDAPDLLQNISKALRRIEHNYCLRVRMSSSGRMLSDGKGSRRVVASALIALRRSSRPARILFLSNNAVTLPLQRWLRDKAGEQVIPFEDRLSVADVRRLKPDFIISYNYRHLLGSEVLALMGGRALNLHISLLPWNRGAHPNLWSFLENTPKGVSIHLMGEKVDAGPILLQERMEFNPDRETLASSYAQLHARIQGLLRTHWQGLKAMSIVPVRQCGRGSIHRLSDFEKVKPLLERCGWDTKVSRLCQAYRTEQ